MKTGKISKHKMAGGKAGRDPHADPAHHKANKEHGMAAGFSPKDESDSTGGEDHCAGEGMASNTECC